MDQRSQYIIGLLLLIATPCLGDHFLGAEIRYAPTGIEPYTYTIEVDMYTDLSSPADRPWILLNSVDTVPRVQITDLPSPTRCGSIRLSTYRTIQTYPGPGVYTIRFEDENRSGGILNIPNSLTQRACVEALLVINPISGANTSIAFDTMQAVLRWEQNTLIHDPGAWDEDGDSLSFELVAVKGAGCLGIPGYAMADGYGALLAESTGMFLWEAPPFFGEWNVTIRGSEYRAGQLIGQVTRDMTICMFPADVGIAQVTASEEFSIRPTITDHVIWIDAEGIWTVEIMDGSGRVVHREQNATKDGPLTLTSLAEGVYSIRALNASGVTRLARFVKTR